MENKKFAECQRHGCNNKSHLTKCHFCKSYFCQKHITPKRAGMANFNSRTQDNEELMSAWRKEDAHPCVPYYDHLKNEEDKKKKSWGETLSWLLDKKKSPSKDAHEEYTNDYPDYNYPDNFPITKQSKIIEESKPTPIKK